MPSTIITFGRFHMEFIRNEMDWQLKSGRHTILDCKIGKPAIYVGYGEESVEM